MPKKGSGMGKGPWAKDGRNYVRKTTGPVKVQPVYGVLARQDIEAFEFFFQTRRYTEVAEKFGVSPTAVHKHADKHEWLSRLTKRLEKIQDLADDKLAERLARDSSKHYNLMSLVQVNAGNILRRPNLQAGDSVAPASLSMTAGALETSIKVQRLIGGETTDKKELTLKDFFASLADLEQKRRQQGLPPPA